MSKTKVVDRAEVVELIIQEKKLGDSAQSSSALSLIFSNSKLKVVRPRVVRPQSYDKSDKLKEYILHVHPAFRGFDELSFSKINRFTAQ